MSKLLKERREELGKELQAIAEATRIKGAYLRSIEEEEFDKLPVEVYTRGYIKEYAESLGIPADVALEPYEKYLQENKAAGKDKDAYHEKTVATLTREVAESLEAFKVRGDLEDADILLLPEDSGRAVKKFPSKMSWIILAVAVAAGIYFLFPSVKNAPPVTQRNEQSVQTPGASSPPASPVLQPPVVSPEPKVTSESLSSKQEKPQLQGEKSTAAKKKHVLTIYATGSVWIKVVIDGIENKEVLLNEGDKVSYEAKESFLLTIGNAAGAKVIFDGKSFEDLGAKGEVVRLNFRHSSLQLPIVKQKELQEPPEQPSEPVPSQEAPDTSEH